MNTQPFLSVGICTYNHKDFIVKTLKSVLDQSYKDFEIVIGDDGSTDGTQEILLDYKKNYPNKIFLVLSDQNAGITINGNKVHRICRGKYIAWLGGDDLMLPGKLEKQISFMETHPNCNLLYHNLEVFDSTTNKILQLYNLRNDKHRGTVKKLIKYGTFNGGSSTMLRHGASPLYGHDERIPVASDWLYWVEHLINGGTIEYIDEVLGKYRRHSRNVSSEAHPLSKQGEMDFFTTCDIINEKYPQFRNAVNFRKSEYLRGIRKKEYKNLGKSLKYNPLNYKSLAIYIIYFVSFKKIKC